MNRIGFIRICYPRLQRTPGVQMAVQLREAQGCCYRSAAEQHIAPWVSTSDFTLQMAPVGAPALWQLCDRNSDSV